MKKFFWLIGLPVVILIAAFFLTGFYVSRPIALIGEGATYWYYRPGSGLPFVSSAEGLLEVEGKDVNVLTRAVQAGLALGKVQDRKILKLPYSGFLYWLSGGKS